MNVSGDQRENNFVNPTYRGDPSVGVVNTSTVSTQPVHVNIIRAQSQKESTLNTFKAPVHGATSVTVFCLQESKWSLFKRKLKPSTTFENPSYSEVCLAIF